MWKRARPGLQKPPVRKEEVTRLLDACHSPGAKLAVGLAAFSGLDPGQIRALGIVVQLLGGSTTRSCRRVDVDTCSMS